MTYSVSADDVTRMQLNVTDEVASILQNVSILIATPKGSIPLDRNFGLDMSFLDRPLMVARSMLVTSVRDALGEYEPRVNVTDVTFGDDVSSPDRLSPIVEVEIPDEQ